MTIALTKIPGIGPSTAKILTENGFESAQQLADTTITLLSKVPGFSAVRASRTIKAANAQLLVSADASAISISKARATQTAMRQQRTAEKPASRAAGSASVPATGARADADMKESEVEKKTRKAQKKAEKAAKKAAKKAKKKARSRKNKK